MPLYDHECDDCGFIFEDIRPSENKLAECPRCFGAAHRIVSAGNTYIGNQDAGWLKTVVEVVDKEGGPHCQEFIKNPTRDNYRNWMQKEGLRSYEKGEKIKPLEPDLGCLKREMLESQRKRNRITVY